jgi:GGDEF domain-containing protein
MQSLANAIPLTAPAGDITLLERRLSAALRVRALHATVLRRSAGVFRPSAIPDSDLLQDASVLLLGRGGSFPALSIALGERVGVIGAFSIEAAGKHLNARDVDGIVIGDGFSVRVVDAFLTVLAEDARFRNLPVIVTGAAAAFLVAPALPNFEAAPLPAAEAAAHALPLVRQHAFEARLQRVLQSLDADGLLDPRTGLLTPDAFAGNLSAAIEETLQRGAGLSAARFVVEPAHDRIRYDTARILGRLMRKTDFATLQNDGAILVVFTETDLRAAHAIARRLASVLRHTPHGFGRDKRIDPAVTLVTLLPGDTATSLQARLVPDDRRAAC